jgi:hypothetical protein
MIIINISSSADNSNVEGVVRIIPVIAKWAILPLPVDALPNEMCKKKWKMIKSN